MTGESDPTRKVICLTGGDRVHFLENLITNSFEEGVLAYAALLTPQGKYLADFFVLSRADDLLLDVDAAAAPGLIQRLSMYKLRADVAIAEAPLFVVRGLGEAPEDAQPDPRDPEMGWRAYRDAPGAAPGIDWDARRVAQVVPETGAELGPESYILEAGFERLHGVDFKKGCYVGQEVTARMKHKTELRKGIVQVEVAGPAEPGTPILTQEGKQAGVLHTRAGDRALAYLKFDWAKGPLTAGEAQVTWRG